MDRNVASFVAVISKGPRERRDHWFVWCSEPPPDETSAPVALVPWGGPPMNAGHTGLWCAELRHLPADGAAMMDAWESQGHTMYPLAICYTPRRKGPGPQRLPQTPVENRRTKCIVRGV